MVGAEAAREVLEARGGVVVGADGALGGRGIAPLHRRARTPLLIPFLTPLLTPLLITLLIPLLTPLLVRLSLSWHKECAWLGVGGGFRAGGRVRGRG